MDTHLHALEQIIKEHSAPLGPQSTSIQPKLTKFEGIKAVLFDIYGTLFISASGDISLAAQGNHEAAIYKALANLNLSIPPNTTALFEHFQKTIQTHQGAQRLKGIEFPEVEIRDVWKDFLEELRISHSPEVIGPLAVHYECLCNPVWPMPKMQETLATLRQSGKLLGLISNAQFYTPLIFPALMEETAEALGFLPEISLFSYKLLEAKPSTTAYQKASQALDAKHKISPEEVLYVGNDMLNDILPAQKTGFKTALFAGDNRSLRLRKDHSLCKNITSDIIITELPQIITCITPHA